MRNSTSKTRQFGLLGKAIQYSFSPSYFRDKFKQEHILDAEYALYDLESIDAFEKLILETEFSGLNVTIPYKEAIIPYLDQLDEVASEINAVNTISFVDGKTTGHNTDVVGFTESIKNLMGNQQVEKAMILGSGGASLAIRYALQKLGIKTVVVSRTPDQQHDQIDYKTLDKPVMEDHQLIVNCTPLGTHPNTNLSPEIPYMFLNEKHLLFDLVYNPKKSLFLTHGELHGCSTMNGYQMLVGQAEASWNIWNTY